MGVSWLACHLIWFYHVNHSPWSSKCLKISSAFMVEFWMTFSCYSGFVPHSLLVQREGRNGTTRINKCAVLNCWQNLVLWWYRVWLRLTDDFVKIVECFDGLYSLRRAQASKYYQGFFITHTRPQSRGHIRNPTSNHDSMCSIQY